MELVPVVKGHKPTCFYRVMDHVWGFTQHLELLFLGRLSLKVHLSLCFMNCTQNTESLGVGLVWAAQHRGISLS